MTNQIQITNPPACAFWFLINFKLLYQDKSCFNSFENQNGIGGQVSQF